MANLPAAGVPKDLAGFEAASDQIKYRMLISSQGREKCGKTEFGLTAPGPIAIINMDDGLEGVVEKWVKKKKVWVANFPIPPMASKDTYLSIWNKSNDAFNRAFSNKDVRTVIVDTGSDWWELIRLAEFGQLSPAVDIKRAYGPLNQKFKSLIRTAYSSDKNFILTHKMKEVYTTKTVSQGNKLVTIDSWDGQTYAKTGFKEDAYLIQVNIEHRYRNGQFEIEVINCRQNMSIAGFVMSQSECTFQDLGTLVFEDTTKEDWQ